MPHGAVADPDGEDAVDASRQASESLLEDDRRTAAHRGDGDQLQGGRAARAEAEHVPVRRDVLTRRRGGIAR